jgi:lipopolysaccharide/colanic/teichoic acid biosynthesis glycosyltransferase
MSFLPADVPISKRIFDLIFSMVIIIFISPFLLLIFFAILVNLGQPIFFRQLRPGLNSEPFTIFKFRTMLNEVDEDGKLLPDAKRITRLGRILRSASLDELPEFFNILKGEMSLVGPRPLLMQYLERYNAQQARRHEVLPGITGWAQVNGRNTITWDDKFRYDVYYVDHWSFWFDLKILGLTFWKVLIREGISQPGHISAGEFMGSDNQSHQELNDTVDN